MSFRLFIYYCALCGGWAAFIGWAVSLFVVRGNPDEVLFAGTKGLLVGLFIALGLSLVDALWNLSARQLGQIFMRVFVAVVIGSLGGLVGGMVGQALYRAMPVGAFLVLGWTLTGLLIGTSIGLFEWIMSLVTNRDQAGAQKKLLKTLLGGTLGGVVGGVLALGMLALWGGIFRDRNQNDLWSPWASGFVALGACIGLLIGLAQVVLKEAWVRVETGFKSGREKILAKERTTIGRAEACDIGLFGDPAVEKVHANIVQAGDRYYLEDAGTPAGTFLNDRQVNGRTPLRDGDRIRVGRNVLCFRERQKR
jgi:hypothetical protein